MNWIIGLEPSKPFEPSELIERKRAMPTFKRRDQEEMEKAKDLLEAAPGAELSFVKSLFFGRLKLDAVMPYPKQDPDEKRRTDELIEKFIREFVAYQEKQANHWHA